MNDCNAEARVVMFLCDDVMVVVFVWAFVVIYSDYRCMCVMAAVTSSINQTTHKPHFGVRFTLEGKRPYGSGEQIKWEPSLLGNLSCQFWEIQSEAWPGDYYHLPRTVKEGIGRLHLMTTQTTRYRCNQNHFKSKTSLFSCT